MGRVADARIEKLPPDIRVTVQSNLVLKRYPTQDGLLPWYVDWGVLDRHPVFRHLVEEPDAFPVQTFNEAIRRQSEEDAHLLHAGLACAVSRGIGRTDSALRRVERGLAEYPASGVLKIEQGRLTALLSAGRPGARAKAVALWKAALTDRSIPAWIRQRLRGELRFLRALPAAVSYPPELADAGEWGASVRAVLGRERSAWTPKELGETASRDLADFLLVHAASKWARFFLFLRSWLWTVIVPDRFDDIVGPRDLLSKARLIACGDPSVDLVECDRVAGQERYRLRLAAGDASYEFVVDRPNTAIAAYNNVLRRLKRRECFHRVDNIGPSGLLCLAFMSEAQMRVARRRRLLAATGL